MSVQTGRPFFELVQQCRCANEVCDAVIPDGCIASKMDDVSGVRTVKAYCRYCDTLWLGKFILLGNQWLVYEPPHAITDTRLRNNFRAKIAPALGEVHRKAV